MKFLRVFIYLLLLQVPFSVFSQQVEEKLVVRDAGDSLFLKAFRSAFDSSGNYYFETMLPGKGERFAMITNRKKISPVFWSKNVGLAPYKSLISDAFFADSAGKRLYYKNKAGVKVYGPHAGRVRNVLEAGRDNIAMELCVGRKSYLYINDSMVNEADSLHQLWLCAFSDNGHVLYTVYKKGAFRLYLDHREIDSAEEMFSLISVNNSSFYTYVKPLGGKYYVHTTSGKYGPFKNVDYSDLWNNGAWYYRGCADSQCFVLINGKLYDKIAEAHSMSEYGLYHSDEQIFVQPYAPDNYLFAYNQQNADGMFINVNGKTTRVNYNTIGTISGDRHGGYAFWGYRKDSSGADKIFKNINGSESALPPSRRAGAVPRAVVVDAAGSAVYYYQTRDSVFLYRDEVLLASAHRKDFQPWDASVLPLSHPEGLEYFQGINIGNRAYIVYNGRVSEPLPVINTRYDIFDEPQQGAIVAGDVNANGFYAIVCTAPGKYRLIINNQVYKDLSGIDHIIGDQGYLDAHRLIFYGIKGSGFYQFTVEF